jgi:Helix-turn-helix domain
MGCETDAVVQIRCFIAGEPPEIPLSSLHERPPVGAVLRRRRLALGIDIDEPAAALKINPAYLWAIEGGCPNQLTGAHTPSGSSRHTPISRAGQHGAAAPVQAGVCGLNAKPDLTFPAPLNEGSQPTGRVLILAVVLAARSYGVWCHWCGPEREPAERVTEVPVEFLALHPPVEGPVQSKFGRCCRFFGGSASR